MENRIEKRFDPAPFQTMIDGKPVKLTELSYDDLMQVACEAQVTVERLEEVITGAARTANDLLDDYHRGRTKPLPEGE